jgi:hypothetical protein
MLCFVKTLLRDALPLWNVIWVSELEEIKRLWDGKQTNKQKRLQGAHVTEWSILLGPLGFTLWGVGVWLPDPTFGVPAYITIQNFVCSKNFKVMRKIIKICQFYWILIDHVFLIFREVLVLITPAPRGFSQRFTKTRRTEHHKTLSTHTRPHTYCGGTRPSLGLTARFLTINNQQIVLIFNKLILTILSTSVTHTRQHACNICEAFPSKCWSPSDDDHHWPKHVKA